MEGSDPFEIKEGLPPNYKGRIYQGAACYHMVIFKMIGSKKKYCGTIVCFLFSGQHCSCCITCYDFKYPTVLCSKFTNRDFEFHTVLTGGAEYIVNKDSGKMAKAGTFNVLGYSGLQNQISLNRGDTMTIDFHYDETAFKRLLKSSPKQKKRFGNVKYGENFALFKNNVFGDIPFFAQLVRSMDDIERMIDQKELDDISAELLLTAVDLPGFPAVDLIDWECFCFTVNLPSILKECKYKMASLLEVAESRGLAWSKIVKLSHRLYASSPRALITNLKFKEFEVLYGRGYSKKELEAHFGEERAGRLEMFVMRYLDFDIKTFKKTYPFK